MVIWVDNKGIWVLRIEKKEKKYDRIKMEVAKGRGWKKGRMSVKNSAQWKSWEKDYFEKEIKKAIKIIWKKH